jgi:YHS domain-containing protein
MIDLVPALLASVLLLAASIGVGVFLQRYKASVTEMLGMMIGMTLGMMTGFSVGFFVGAASDMFISNLVGIAVGVGLGVAFGRMGGLMGSMDGGMGGMMGGMMGAMLGVMLQYGQAYIWITGIVLAALQLAALAGLVRLVQSNVALMLEVDPVCKMKVNPRTALSTTYQGKAYFFCAPSCRHLFGKDPERYLKSTTCLPM